MSAHPIYIETMRTHTTTQSTMHVSPINVLHILHNTRYQPHFPRRHSRLKVTSRRESHLKNARFQHHKLVALPRQMNAIADVRMSSNTRLQNPEIPLPAPDATGTRTLEQILADRRAVSITDSNIMESTSTCSLFDIAQLCWAAQGLHTDETDKHLVHPQGVYIITTNRVEDIAPGVYKYLPNQHSLMCCRLDIDDPLYPSTFSALVEASTSEQAKNAAFLVFISGDIDVVARHGGVYTSYADELVRLEAGMVAETILLQAMSLGLECVPVGGFAVDNEIVRNKLCIAQGEAPLLLLTVYKMR